MKVTLVISKLSGGGAERVACNLANHFARAGWEVGMLTFDEVPACEVLEGSIGCTTLLSAREKCGISIVNLLRRLPRLHKYLRTQPMDVCIVMLPIPTILVLALSRLTKARIIAAERGEPTRYKRLFRQLLRRLCPRAAAWVFQTETVRGWYLPHLGDVPSVVIPNAINPAFLAAPAEDEREKTIVSVGRLCPQKNFGLLIRAFARIAPAYPDYRLVIYGRGGLLEELQALARELGVADRVDFPGHVDDMPRRLRRAGMYVLSSDYEGMPNALIEAMAQGLPCVATDCDGGGARCLVEDGVNGLMIPTCNEDAMAEAIGRILSDQELAQTLGHNALQARDTLAPERIYGLWQDVVTSACTKGNE